MLALRSFRYMIFIMGLLVIPLALPAQDEELEGDTMYVDLGTRMLMFMEELDELKTVSDIRLTVNGAMPVSQSLVAVYRERIQLMYQNFNTIDVKWNTFYQANQQDIAQDEELMEVVAAFQEIKQALADTLAAKRESVGALKDFMEADAFIIGKIPAYRDLSKKAFELSLIKKLKPQLEKLKAKEQLLFSEVQAHYDKAKAATAVIPDLSARLRIVEEQYINIKSTSEKIQAMAYKPFIQRIKDYLLGLAAVAIIIMFMNAAASRFKAWKQMRESMKKYKDMMNGQSNNYPTI